MLRNRPGLHLRQPLPCHRRPLHRQTHNHPHHHRLRLQNTRRHEHHRHHGMLRPRLSPDELLPLRLHPRRQLLPLRLQLCRWRALRLDQDAASPGPHARRRRLHHEPVQMLRRQRLLQQRPGVHFLRRIGLLLHRNRGSDQHPCRGRRLRLLVIIRRPFSRRGSGHCRRRRGGRRTPRRGSCLVLSHKTESGSGNTRVQQRL